MNKAKGNWRQLRQLWPVAVAVLAACGGASDPAESAANTDDTVATTTGMESAEGRRRNGWVYCAAEGGTCAVPSTRLVRYGANGAYFYRTISGSIACDNSMWGDPVAGVAKKCDYSASTSTTAPAPAPAAALTWSVSTNANVVAYKVYYGLASGSYFQSFGSGISAGNGVMYTVYGLTTGQTYYFAVTAVDAAGVESQFSNEASKLMQ
jgi:hypothetical protein